MLNLILNGQIGMADRLGAAGFKSKAIEFIPKIRKTAVEMAEASGLKNPDDYYPPISDQELQAMQQQAQQPPQPDPKTQADIAHQQAQLQLQGEKQKADQLAQDQKNQNDAIAQQQNFQLKQAQLAQELQLKREQLSAELQLKREQMMMELALKRELGHASNAVKANGHASNADVTSSVHVGGQPG